MNKIPSFTIDHLRLLPGVYVSRQDRLPSGEVLTTLDVRMKAPNREPVMDQRAMHTIEHLAATYLRNDPVWKERVVYWGPMGCLTGSYLILVGEVTSQEVVPLLIETFRFVADYEGDIPGATAMDCGCADLHDLTLAQQEAGVFLRVLETIGPERLEYPA